MRYFFKSSSKLLYKDISGEMSYLPIFVVKLGWAISMTHPEVALFEDIGCEPNATILSNLAYPLFISNGFWIYIQLPLVRLRQTVVNSADWIHFGAYRDWTDDLQNANLALSQLS